jgi:hypothetical protein
MLAVCGVLANDKEWFFNGIIRNVLCVSYVWCVSKGVYYIRCRIYGILNNEVNNAVNRGVVGRVLNKVS